MMTRWRFWLLQLLVLIPVAADATSFAKPLPCPIPREAYAQCVHGKVMLNVVVDADGRLISSTVSSADPSPMLDQWAECLAEKYDAAIDVGGAARLGAGAHKVPIILDIQECPSAEQLGNRKDVGNKPTE